MDNTVGSLTQFQKSVVVGSLLGDGYIRIVPGRKDAFLEINHSSSQREYVDWKYDVLSSISRSAPKERKGNGRRIAYRFTTRQMPEMTYLMYLWYQKGKKVVPTNLVLNPTTLATWFMDDGSMCRESDVYLNTQQFDLFSQGVLVEKLRQVGLHTTLNKDKQYQRIRFLKSSIPLLKEIISPHIIPSMKYKLGYDPVETTRQSPMFTERRMKI
jgi:hypothetical protein